MQKNKKYGELLNIIEKDREDLAALFLCGGE